MGELRKHGDLLNRLSDKMLIGDGCWEWTAAKVDGYGRININGKSALAHRVVYELFNEIPEGLTLDHLCRNHSCVRPDHLEAVTHRENVLRGEGVPALRARKTHCPQGHEYTPENTYTRPSRYERQCRVCMERRNRAQAIR